jgi:oligoribonuclease (3'-5' exoribonuclease)
MDKDEIIEMARQAGFSIVDGIVTGGTTDMRRFAKLVEDAAFKRWAAQTKLAVEYECEACAREADWCIQNHLEQHIPERIRARDGTPLRGEV